MTCWKCGNELGTADSGGAGLCTACLAKPATEILGSVWNLTPKLRWRKCRQGEPFMVLGTDAEQYHMVLILQQLWRNELGAEEWRDVPMEGQ